MAVRKTTGLIAAPPTPLADDGELNLDAVEAQVEALTRNGVVGAFVCGTTGEGMSLTVDERVRLVERWTAAAPDGFDVIVHVGHTCEPASRELLAAAARAGARACGTMPPLLYKPPGVGEAAEFVVRLAAAAGDMPLYYYHIPSVTGVHLPVRELLARVGERAGNLAGVKFTHEDLADYALCLDADGGRYDCLFGRDQMLLGALAVGATGAIGSTYNFLAPLFLRLIEAFEGGRLDEARRLQGRAARLLDVTGRHGHPIACFKAMTALTGVDVGPPRPPVAPLSGEALADLRRDLEAAGFRDICSK